MKKMRLGILLAALLTVCMSVSAFAEDYKGKEGMEVVFDGKALTPNFSSADLGAAGEMQPGDTITYTITVRNASGEDADFWLKNEIVKSFEESVSASGGAYTYSLTYSGLSSPIFDSTAVGGTDSAGLAEATDSMDEYIFLERLANGGSGELTLVVGIDGITQGNAYQNALADLMIQLAAEKPQEGEEVVVHENKVVTQRVVRAVKTGDRSPLMALSIAAIISGAVLLAFAILKLRRNAGKGGSQV